MSFATSWPEFVRVESRRNVRQAVPAADRCGPQDFGRHSLPYKTLGANRSGSTPAFPQHLGFALIDLIAVVCAVALVTAIVVYGIQQSRIRARSLGCRDNLRQMGVALSQYTDTYRTLPTVTFAGSDYRLTHSPLALLVPLLPQESRASLSSSAGSEATYDSTQPWFRQREGFAAAVVPTFRCPASRHRDPVESIEAERTHCPLGILLATADYIVCKGPNDSWCLDGGVSAVPLKQRGAFEIGRPLRPSDISDGLAQTIVLGEGASGRQWSLALKDRFPLTLIDRQTMQPLPAFNYWGWPFLNTSEEQRQTQAVAAGVFGTTAVELNRRPVVETILNTSKLDDCKPRYKNGFHAVSNFRSDHDGGAYFLFADGASHFVSEGIVPDVYRALSSIAGAESVDYIN
jgi:type II secretory pathway pseudopilin PulG